MNEERDKFLIEAMGLVYHDFHYGYCSWYCNTCEVEHDESHPDSVYHTNIDFSTWEGFGKLWEWSNKQEWWQLWKDEWYAAYGLDWIVNQDHFANAVYEYLQEYRI